MDFDPNMWMEELAGKLQAAFSSQLLFVGLQGSRRRGEADEQSDIDVVAVLSFLTLKDLARYRAILKGMPHGELACGFIGGQRELLSWPRHDLWALMMDTKAYFGDLAALMPPLGREDARDCALHGAANLYHAACHSFLYEKAPRESLPGLFKSAYFVLAAEAYLRFGEFPESKRALLPRLEGREREILALCISREVLLSADAALTSHYYGMLIGWCGELLARLAQAGGGGQPSP